MAPIKDIVIITEEPWITPDMVGKNINFLIYTRASYCVLKDTLGPYSPKTVLSLVLMAPQTQKLHFAPVLKARKLCGNS